MKAVRFEVDEFPAERVRSLTGGALLPSPGFLLLWSTLGGRPVYWSVELDGRTVGILPGVEFGRRPVKRFQSLPDGCYGGPWIDPDCDAADTAARVLLDGVVAAGYARLFIYDFRRVFSSNGPCTVEQCVTNLVDVGDPGWEPPDAKIRSEVRKARREEIEIVPFDSSRHMTPFLRLMADTESRHGRAPKYPERFFTALADLARRDDRIVWWWCEHDGAPAASHVNFIEGSMGINWQVYFDKTFSYLKPNQFLLYRFAHLLRERGGTTLNLGASPPEAESLIEYKQKWGGSSCAYPCYVLKRGLGRLK